MSVSIPSDPVFSKNQPITANKILRPTVTETPAILHPLSLSVSNWKSILEVNRGQKLSNLWNEFLGYEVNKETSSWAENNSQGEKDTEQVNQVLRHVRVYPFGPVFQCWNIISYETKITLQLDLMIHYIWRHETNLFPTENQKRKAMYNTEITSPFNVVESADDDGLCPPKTSHSNGSYH